MDGACLDENALVEFAEGRVPEARAQAIEEHIDRCARCASLVAEFARTLAATSPAPGLPGELPWLANGAEVGRYVIREWLGSGGMGQVYGADDPDLGRRVAIKVVQGAGSGEQEQRLLREAKAMAQLSHPNVVAVHDVGIVGKRAFIAMELVAGETLDSWCAAEPRTWRDIVRAFDEAGRGLAAAHEADIVHRDFKPGNVLVREDGRVQVTDFGLARAKPGQAGADPVPACPDLTRTGAVLGTPAYMSPEQHRGAAADARSDQFAFCVALYEALYGERPFPGDDSPAIAAAACAGRIRPAPRDTAVPAHVRRVLQRGLQVNAEDRFSDMGDLLAALARDPARARRRWLLAIGGLVVAALAFAIVYRVGAAKSAEQPQCDDGAEEVARVWGEDQHHIVRDAFMATGQPSADTSWRKTASLLDDYASAYTRTRLEACQATRLRKEQSAEVLDLRALCLRRRLDEFGSLVEVFATADGGVVRHSVAAAHQLVGVESCDAARVVDQRGMLPRDEATAARVEEALSKLGKARALRDAGKHTEALEQMRALEAPARAIGYRRLEAEVQDVIVGAEIRRRDYQAAEHAAFESLFAAQAAGDSNMIARAALRLAQSQSTDRARADEAERWLRHAAAALEHAGGDPELEALLATSRAGASFQKGDYEEALAGYEEALRRKREVHGAGHPSVADAESTIGSVYIRLGRHREAVEALERSLAVLEAAFGADHPRLMGALNDLGAALERVGEIDRAIQVHRRSIALRAKAHGADSARVAAGLSNLGMALERKGDLEEAQTHLERAVAIFERDGLEQNLAASLINLAAVLGKRGKVAEAEQRARRALTVCEKAFGKDHPHVASVLVNLGEILCEEKRCEQAMPLYRRSLVIREQKLGQEHVEVTYSLEGLATGHMALGAPGKAIPILERALSILEPYPARAADAALIRFHLARALWDSRRDRPRAVRAARAARDVFAEKSDDRAKSVEVWLAEHGGDAGH